MNQRDKIELIKNGKMKDSLLIICIPTMIGMIITALYYLVDSYFVSGLGHEQLAAISVVFPIFQIILGIGLIFGSGAGSFISRLLGQNDLDRANSTATMSILYGIITTFIFSITILVFLKPILIFIGATDSIIKYAQSYSKIVILSSYLTVFNITMNNLMTSEGRSNITMSIMAMGAILNIFLDPIFIYKFNLGINGAAYATAIAQAITTLLYIYRILSKKNLLKIGLRYIKKDLYILVEIFRIGIPIFLNRILTSVSVGLTNMAAKPYGDDAIAAMGIMLRVMSIGLYVVFGFTKGFIPVIGINYGSGENKRVKSAIKITKRWGFIFCALFGGIIMISARPIAILFAKDGPEFLIEIATKALVYNGLAFVFFSYQNIYSSAFLAMGKALEAGVLNLSRQGIFFIPLIIILPRLFGLKGLIITQPIADILTLNLTRYFVYKNRELI
ncbi:MAG: MATE family efflux transporter [Tissierellia bacterium]|nr:MATE family efflux transporter [Tissierellia bacterium]